MTMLMMIGDDDCNYDNYCDVDDNAQNCTMKIAITITKWQPIQYNDAKLGQSGWQWRG